MTLREVPAVRQGRPGAMQPAELRSRAQPGCATRIRELTAYAATGDRPRTRSDSRSSGPQPPGGGAHNGCGQSGRRSDGFGDLVGSRRGCMAGLLRVVTATVNRSGMSPFNGFEGLRAHGRPFIQPPEFAWRPHRYPTSPRFGGVPTRSPRTKRDSAAFGGTVATMAE